MNHPHDPDRSIHPDMRQDAPGRIPESLIDAAIDGELNEDMQREIAHALRYDPVRKQELIETSDAINALQMPVSTPCFTDAVLDRVDRRRKFIPASWRKHVRTGRLGIAAALLLSLMTVAGLQRMYPRLTTIASHPTPVMDLENALESGADQFASKVSKEIKTYRASVAPMASLLSAPGRRDHQFQVSNVTTLNSADFPSRTVGEIRLVGIGNGIAAIYLGPENETSRFPTRRFGQWGLHSNSYFAGTQFAGTQFAGNHSAGSQGLASWSYQPGVIQPLEISRSKSQGDRDSTELDVSALP